MTNRQLSKSNAYADVELLSAHLEIVDCLASEFVDKTPVVTNLSFQKLKELYSRRQTELHIRSSVSCLRELLLDDLLQKVWHSVIRPYLAIEEIV